VASSQRSREDQVEDGPFAVLIILGHMGILVF
jgi:hypothetical protein